MRYVLVIRTDGVVFGPFATEEGAKAEARRYYDSDEEYEHADTNADFYICRLFADVREMQRGGSR